MMLRRSFMATSTAGAIQAASAFAFAQTRTTAVSKTGYASVNGLNMYYEIRGSGEPLILLHGGLGATGIFSVILPMLSTSRRVIALDLQAHGRTADIDRPLSFEAMADDVGALMKHLEIEKADVMGYSLGGGVALRTAVRYPDVVKKLVIVSTAFRRDGWYPEIVAGMSQIGAGAAETMKQTPMYQMYARIAPKPADWPVLLTKIGDLLRKDYDWSKDVEAIKAPTLLVFGDADAVRTAHAVQFFELLGGGKRDGGWDGSGISNAQLAILPGLTHYNVFSSPALATMATSFLDAPHAGSQVSMQMRRVFFAVSSFDAKMICDTVLVVPSHCFLVGPHHSYVGTGKHHLNSESLA
jgi:pimeloyl-ACP methyl ester carboxylesterase